MTSTIAIASVAEAQSLTNTCISLNIISQTDTAILGADTSGLCVIVHNRGAKINVDAVAVRLDSDGIRVIMKHTPIIVVLPETKFFKTTTANVDITSRFQKLATVRSVQFLNAIVSITEHPSGDNSSLTASDPTGTVAVTLFDGSAPPPGWLYAINITVQTLRTRDQATETVRVLPSLDLQAPGKRTYSGFLFPLPDQAAATMATTPISLKRVDLPPVQLLDPREAFATNDTNTYFALPEAVVTGMENFNTHATAKSPSMVLLRVRFTFVGDPFEHLLTFMPYHPCTLPPTTSSFSIQYVRRNIWNSSKSFQTTCFSSITSSKLGNHDWIASHVTRAKSTSLSAQSPPKRQREDRVETLTQLHEDDAL